MPPKKIVDSGKILNCFFSLGFEDRLRLKCLKKWGLPWAKWKQNGCPFRCRIVDE